MKTALLIALLLMSGAISAPVSAEEKNNLPTPDPGNVTLTLDEFNRLTELASKLPKKPDVPPLAYSLKHASLKLKAGDDSVTGTIQFDGEVMKRGTVKVPLTVGVTIFDAHREGKPVPIQLADGVQTAVLSGPSDFSIQLDAGLALRIDAGRVLPSPSSIRWQRDTVALSSRRTYIGRHQSRPNYQSQLRQWSYQHRSHTRPRTIDEHLVDDS